MPSARDLLLAPSLSPEQAAAVLAPYGFQDAGRADENLQALAADPLVRPLLADIVEDLLGAVASSADPDQSLARFERFATASLGRRELLSYLKEAPRTVELLARAFGASAFMAEILIRDPGYFHWVADPAVLRARRGKAVLRRELASALAPFRTEARQREALRIFKRREMLHIGVRDIVRRSSVESTLRALSDLADVLTQAAVEISSEAMRAEGGRAPALAVVGLGKLGGGELNFSSDVDLLYVLADEDGAPVEAGESLARRVTEALAATTNEGHVFRVDLRLRPEGQMGAIAPSLSGLRRYYAERGQTWERLALIKARVVAGDRRLGARMRTTVAPFVFERPFGAADLEAVRGLKQQVDARIAGRGETSTNVKLGRGGIREVELVVQALQLRFGGGDPTLRPSGTLAALSALRDAGRLPPAEHEVLARAYLFLRDVENKLQMAADAQVHSLPSDPVLLRTLARTLGYPDTAPLLSDYASHTNHVRSVFDGLFQEGRWLQLNG